MTARVRGRLLGCLMLCMALSAWSLGRGGARADTPIDYMIQEVCDNGSGGHTNADPVTCPATARKLNIGEALPYHKWDSVSAQISDSFPIADISNRFRVVQMEFFDNPSAFIQPLFDAGDPHTGRSGYDMIMDDGSYVSAEGTYDPGAGWQPMWMNSQCALGDTWILAPKTATIPFGQGAANSTINNTSPQCPPNSNYGTADTVWNYYAGLLYESGKRLNTIKVFHFGGPTINTQSIEMFYFTKEYGKTRWEAWNSTVSGPNSAAVAACPTGTNGGVSVFGSTTYYLLDCHDWSFVQASPTGDWSPSVNWHVDPLYNSVNELVNTHMQCTNSSGVSGHCGGSTVCQTIAGWGRIGDLNWGYDQNIQAPTASSNCALIFSIPDGPSGQGVYQDALAPGRAQAHWAAGNYTFGAFLWSPTGATITGTMTVFQLNSALGIISQTNVPFTVGATRTFFQGAFTVTGTSTARFRFQIYPGTVGPNYEITESWIAPAV
jgi:hypothetical protein